MRKLFYSFLFSTSIFTTINAQNSSELSIGIGDATTYEIFFEFEDLISELLPVVFGHHFSENVSVSTPYLFLDYRKPISERMKVGAQIGYYSYEGTTTEYTSSNTVYDIYNVKKSIFLVMPGLDYTYFERNKFRFYGNVMLGVGFASSEAKGTYDHSLSGDDNGVLFTFQVNPIGLSYGEQFKVFLEGGIGISLVNAGLRFKL